MSRQAKHLLEFGPFQIDLEERALMRDQQTIPLSPKAFETLLVLVQHSERVVLKDDLMKTLWPDTFVEESNLSQHIFQIRKALGEKAHDPQYIVTVPGRGYRFAQKVAELMEPDGDLIVHSRSIQRVTLEETASGQSSAAIASFSRLSQKPWNWILGAAAVVALALGGGYAVRSRMGRNRRPNLEKFRVMKLTDSGQVELAAISGDGRYVCYSRRDRGGSGLWLHQVATHSDVQVLPAEAIGFEGLTFSPDGNHIYYVRADKNDPGFKYLYVMPVLGGPSRLLIKDVDSPVSFSPDGHQFVYTRGIPTRKSTDVRIANSDGSGDRLLAAIENTFPGFQPGATWSPDGRTVAVSLRLYVGRHSYILDAVSAVDGSVRELYSSSRAIGRPLWLPEGDTLLLVMNDQNDRGQLWTISYPNAEVRRVTNDLTDFDTRADLTRDAKTMLAIANHPTANVWVAPAADLSQARQITSAALPLFRVAEAPDGHLLATSMDGKLWSLEADGSRRIPFTDLPVTDFQGGPAPCGRLIVFLSGRTATTELVRVAADGADPTQLVTGDLNSFVCTLDGKYVFYDDLHTISRIPVEGGPPVEIAQILGAHMAGRLSISPDGKFLAYPYADSPPAPSIKLAIISAEGGSPTKVLGAPGIVWGLLWSTDGKSLQYSFLQNGASNIWEQPLTGGEPRPLTKFSSGLIFDFHWSLDGKRLLMTRGEVSSDAALLSDLR
jgi:DNA-binding winged helix-turn-helix (wHTH) protein/Tol biopolymer transport system component